MACLYKALSLTAEEAKQGTRILKALCYMHQVYLQSMRKIFITAKIEIK